MGSVVDGLRSLLGGLRRKAAVAPCQATSGVFRERYNHFQSLLESNAELLKIIAEMDVKLAGHEVFGMAFVTSRGSRAIFHAIRLIKSFEGLSGQSLPQLLALTAKLQAEIKAAIEGARIPAGGRLILPLSESAADMVDLVGGKSANLGEVGNRVGLPVPAGFTVTTAAFRAFFAAAGLDEEIASIRLGIKPDDPASLTEASEAIQAAILRAPLPEPLAEGLAEAVARLASEAGVAACDLRLAVRSSAIGEDGELSFAGQYLSMLNVIPSRLESAYKYVVASLYTPRAISYRLLKGIPDDGLAMSALCLRMVESVAAGVLFTRLPEDPDLDMVLINAVWGLGPFAVDGVVTPDAYLLSRPEVALVEQSVADKPRQLGVTASGGLAEAAVPEARRRTPCLSEDQARQLATWGLALERHFGKPQDVEWALDPEGKLTVLQSRQLTALAPGAHRAEPPVPGAEVMTEGGQAACGGAGAGPVHPVRTMEDLPGFPEGGVLVAAHSSPKFMVAMPRAAAIVTEHGSPTGHMASLAREFGVPALLGVKDALATLPAGEVVTVDASAGRIYRGRVDKLLAAAPARQTFMGNTKVHAILSAVAGRISPLNLIDPKAPDFTPEGCRTLHDIMRLLHELSYGAMFSISDLASGQSGLAVTLEATTGLDLHIIDLGGGIEAAAKSRCRVRPEEITSRPFRALLTGLVLDASAMAPRPVNLGGFFSVMSEQMLSQPKAGADRFGDKSYAIISDKYLNFSSRVGYHYGVLDCYCGHTVNKNYITFSFMGGAADDVKRGRRVRAIARILAALGFTVDITGDRVAGRFQKAEPEVIEAKLAHMGRLLQFTRQTDMLMVSEESVAAMAECFMSGGKSFDPAATGQEAR